MAKNNLTAAEAVVDALIEEGVEVVFGMTGDTVLPLLDAMYHRKDEIRYVTARVETGATAMADTYSRTTGKIGCCLFHVGPSVANTILGAWSAQKDAVPLLVMSANMDTFRLDRNIWHEFDVMGVYSKFTKWQGQLAQAKDARRLMRNAFQAAKSGMPGVVHIDFPKDILPQPADVESTDLSLLGGAHSAATSNRPRPEAWAVTEAASLLKQAQKPLILAGRGVRWGGGAQQLVALAEAMTIPVITTEMGRGTMPEDHPLAGGLVGHFGHSAANGLLREADVVLGLGSRFLNVSTINWSMIAPETKIIQVETDPLEIGKQYAVELGIHADSGVFLDDLCAEVGATGSAEIDEAHPRVKHVADLIADQHARYYDTDLDAVPIKPQRITKAIEEICDRDAIFVFGSGLHTQFAHRAFIGAGCAQGLGLLAQVLMNLRYQQRLHGLRQAFAQGFNVLRLVLVAEVRVVQDAQALQGEAVVALLGGKEGLVHVSQIAEERVEKVTDYLSEGQAIRVKVTEIDRQGRIRMSMRNLDGEVKKETKAKEPEKSETTNEVKD